MISATLQSYIQRHFQNPKSRRSRKLRKGGHVACLERLEERVMLTADPANNEIDVGEQLALATTAAVAAQEAFNAALTGGQTSHAGLQSDFAGAAALHRATFDASMQTTTETLQTTISGAQSTFDTNMAGVNETATTSDAANQQTLADDATLVSGAFDSEIAPAMRLRIQNWLQQHRLMILRSMY